MFNSILRYAPAMITCDSKSRKNTNGKSILGAIRDIVMNMTFNKNK